MTCPDCGRESPDDALFCASCGAALAAPTEAREERKVVSVVFVDLVGHTSRSDSADPEDVRATLTPYYVRVRAELERFGGTVEKFIGDAVMAVFGAPVAHEDDPERAVRAALAVRDATVGDGLDVRVAVNTGEALVALGARPEAGESIVAGDVVNTAARLQSAAPVNGVLVGAVTHRATERAIEYRAAHAVDAKGKAAPVQAWEAIAPRARFGVDVVQHGGAALVGREAERRLLWDAFERARREQTLQMVTLVGVPGIGKSRLVWELFRQVDDDSELAYWRQGRALAYGGGPGGAVAEAVRAHLGGVESDAPADVERKLADAVAALPVAEQERVGLVRRLAPLLGIGTEDASSRDEAFSSWRRFFEGLAEQRPLVLVLEDLHWADDSTLDFVDYLADWATGVPMLVVATARPELLERRPTWGGGRLNAHTLSLAPLDERATAELLARLLDSPVIDAEVQAQLLQQSGGNPLYTEEFARMLGEGAVEIPDSVQGIIAARLDLLEQREKELLHDAAVLGKVFWRDGVRALGAEADLDDALQRLVRKEFVRRERGTSIAGDVEYAFRHGLVRDVAYGQIPRGARVEKHRRAAEWIAGSSAPRPDLVAHHYSEALELARSAGSETSELAASARRALRDAGDRARSVGALPDAADLYRRALELWPEDDERPDLLLSLALTAADVSREGATGWLEEAIALFTRRGDHASVSRAELARATLEWTIGNGIATHEHLQRAVDMAERSGSEVALATALSMQARLLGLAGRGDESVAAAEQALALSERLGLEEPTIVALTSLGAQRQGHAGQSWRQNLEQALARSLALNAPLLEERARNNLGHNIRQLEGPGAALGPYEEVWRAAHRNCLPFGVRWAESALTALLRELGRWDEAMEHADTFFRMESGISHYLDTEALSTRGWILHARDRIGEASALFDRALARAREVGDLQLMAPALTWSAAFHLDRGAMAEAEAAIAELEALPPAARRLVTVWDVDVGWLQHDVGRPLIEPSDVASIYTRLNVAIVEGRWEEAVATLDGMEARTSAAYARLRLARRLTAAGDDPEPWLSGAEAFYRPVRATRYLRELDELRIMRRSA
ncbi:MAG: ATP-binding protein [Gaiellaceae bacterium]